MLLRWIDLLFKEPGEFLALIPVILATLVLGLLVAITVHEFSHAFTALSLGDDTARRQGRVSLNPLAHLDPLGSLMLFLVGFGWGKPVPVNPYLLRGNPRAGMAKVALAGPLTNLVLAGLLALPIKLGFFPWHSPFYYPPFAQKGLDWIIADILGYLIFYNVILALFNLIPLAPLDGFNIVAGLLPRETALSFSRLAPFGPGILLLVVFFDYFTNIGLLWRVLGPAADAVGLLLVGKPFL